MNIFNLGPMEIAIIAIVALLVVGPRGLPELGRMVGKWMKTFREASDEMRRSLYLEDDLRRQPPPKPRPSLQHKPASDDDPAALSDKGASQGKYEAEDLDSMPVDDEAKNAATPAETENGKKENTEPKAEARRAYEDNDYNSEGAD